MIGNGKQAIEITGEGGLAYWVINDTGGASIKGTLIEPSSAIDKAVDLLNVDEPDPIGVVYDDAVPLGGMMRIVFSGLAEVLFGNAPTRHNFARNSVAADAVAGGLAISESLPVPPFATDKHFLEIGHIFETKVAPGLALVNLHFN